MVSENESEKEIVVANEQPTPDAKSPIPQPATDGFPAGGEDLTSRVPGGEEKAKDA